jgi:hypothetical protein
MVSADILRPDYRCNRYHAPCFTDREADSEERARKAAYDTHEHISGGLDGIKVREDWICPDGPACKSLTCQNNRVANGFEVWK